jgi:O-antigen/teichoic acid export membrane protein
MKFIRNSVLYTFVTFLQRAVGFFLLPLYTTYLTPADYGVVSVVTSYAGFVGMFALLSLNGAAQRFEFSLPEPERPAIWGTLYLFLIVNAFAVAGICFAFRRWLVMPFAPGIPFFPPMALGLATVAVAPAYILYQTYLVSKQEARSYAANNLAYFTAGLVFTLLFVVRLRMGATGMLLAGAVTGGLFFVHALVFFTPRIRFAFRRAILSKSLRYSLPLLPHALSGWVVLLVNRVFLNYFKGAAAVGLFTIGYQIGNLLNVVTAAINQAYVPWFFEKMGEGEAGTRQVVRAARILTVLYGLAALVLSYFAPEVLRLMVSKSFQRGWVVVPLLSFSFVFSGMYYFFVNPLFLRKTSGVFKVSLTAAVVGVILHLLLVPRFGMQGTAVADFVSAFVMSAAALFFTLRHEPIPFDWKRMYAIVGGFFVLSLLVMFQGRVEARLFFAIKFSVLSAVTGGLYAVYKRSFWATLGPIIEKIRFPGAPAAGA